MFKKLLTRLVSSFALCLIANSALADGELSPENEDPIQEESDRQSTSAKILEQQVMERQRPGGEPRPVIFPPFVFESVPDINSSASQFVPVPDRWRQFYVGKLYDPYNQNVLKGDVPIFGSPGHEWFFELSLISDTLLERRRLPTPVGFASTNSASSTDVFGKTTQSLVVENLVTSFSLIKGNTTFKPPDLELRIVPVINFNHVAINETGALRVDPVRDTTRSDAHVGFQELFLDYHLANLSDRYDFVSTRVGIQRFISDFRGFIYADDQPGVRFFGNLDNNRYQYNLAWFSRLTKDVNSGLNTNFTDRYEDVYVGNLFWQDALVYGHQLQGSVVYRADTAGKHSDYYDENGFLVRPALIGDEMRKNVYSTYFGLNSDGHIGRINTTSAFYYVTGSESHNPIAQQSVDINAAMAALELSYDIDWIRLRSSLFWASGDDNPYDSQAEGFDAIFDTPNFAGGDLSFWQRQGIPLIGGGGVNIVNSRSLLANLRAGKEAGQSNFVNPGIRLLNVGADFELLPELKLITNLSYLQFDNTAVLKVIRQDGSFSRDIGFDISAGALYRPFLNNNIQFRFGTAALVTDDGFENLFGDKVLYDFFGNLILMY